VQIILSLLVVIAVFLLAKSILMLIDKLAKKKSVTDKRLYYLKRFIVGVALFVAIIGVALAFSVDFRGLLVFASSVFAVVGVALFAQWSILSNATASILIFFSFPARVGDCIKIIDGDHSIEGEIVEIALFNTLLKDYYNNTIIYPNNLLLQKPIQKIKQLTQPQDCVEAQTDGKKEV